MRPRRPWVLGEALTDPDAPLDLPAPRRLGRREFVRGCLYATAAGLAAGGAQGVLGLASPRRGPMRRVDYLGATVVGGPAPQGLPLLPLRVGADGTLEGNPAPPAFPDGVLDWYRYCGHERAPGLQRDARPEDEALRYFVSSEKVPTIRGFRDQTGRDDVGWFLGRHGTPARVGDFRAGGWGAPVSWRSEGRTGADIVHAIVLRVDPAQLRLEGLAEGMLEGFFVPTPDGGLLLAYVGFCKHFCCTPGWHETGLAASFDAEEKVYCSCHHSVYDPLRVRPDFFLLEESGAEA